MKYKNLTEVANALKSGELVDHVLVVDNDASYLSFRGVNPHKPDTDDYWIYYDEMSDKASKLYRGNGYRDVYGALDAAGIPWEEC